MSLSTTQLVVRYTATVVLDYYIQTFRLGFRFYVPRLTFGTMTGVSISSSENNSPPWCLRGDCSTSYGADDRRFYVNFYMYKKVEWQNQWRTWNANQYYDFTFTFSSIGDDGGSSDHP